MKYKVPFDDHIKEQLGDYSPEVPGHLWENIRNKKDKKRPFFFFFRTSGFLILSVILGGMTAALLFGHFYNSQTPMAIQAGKTGNLRNKAFVSSIKSSVNVQTRTAVSENQTSSQSHNIIANAGSAQNISSTAVRQSSSVLFAATQSQDVKGSENSAISTSSETASHRNSHATSASRSSAGISQETAVDHFAQQANPAAGVETESEGLSLSTQPMELIKLDAPELAQLKPASVKNLNIPCPDNSGAIKKRTYVEIYGAADYVLRQFSDTPNSTYMRMRKESTSFASAFSAGIRYTKLFSNGFNIRAGLNYSQINEKFKYVQGNIIQVVFIINASGDTIGSYQTSNTRYKTSYNHYKTLDIPVTIGYEFTKNRWNINCNTGLIFNIHSWNQGEVLNESLQPVDISGMTSNPYQFKTNIGVGGVGAISLYYSLNDRISIMGEPYFRYNFSSMNKTDITLKQKYHTSGIRLGLRINLQTGNKN